MLYIADAPKSAKKHFSGETLISDGSLLLSLFKLTGAEFDPDVGYIKNRYINR